MSDNPTEFKACNTENEAVFSRNKIVLSNPFHNHGYAIKIPHWAYIPEVDSLIFKNAGSYVYAVNKMKESFGLHFGSIYSVYKFKDVVVAYNCGNTFEGEKSPDLATNDSKSPQIGWKSLNQDFMESTVDYNARIINSVGYTSIAINTIHTEFITVE